MFAKSQPLLKSNTYAYESDPMVKATGFREYDARWLFGGEINLTGVQALGLGLGTLACATSYSTKACSSTSIRLVKSSPTGLSITTLRGPIPRSLQDARRLCQSSHRNRPSRCALHEGSARCPVAHTAPRGVLTAEALIAIG
jgi:hypothetical protein